MDISSNRTGFGISILWLLLVISGDLSAREIKLDHEVIKLDAGPVGFDARALYVDGQLVDLVYVGFDVSQFSKRFLA